MKSLVVALRSALERLQEGQVVVEAGDPAVEAQRCVVDDHDRRTIPDMSELEKLLATRPDARVAVLGQAAVVSKFVAETEQNLNAALAEAERAGPILFVDEADGLVGKRTEIEDHDGPVVIGARSLHSIPDELRTGLVVVEAPRLPWWRRLIL